jgi:hypothetical protein
MQALSVIGSGATTSNHVKPRLWTSSWALRPAVSHSPKWAEPSKPKRCASLRRRSGGRAGRGLIRVRAFGLAKSVVGLYFSGRHHRQAMTLLLGCLSVCGSVAKCAFGSWPISAPPYWRRRPAPSFYAGLFPGRVGRGFAYNTPNPEH